MPTNVPESAKHSPDLRVWLAALGPGAIVASLTIGTGELVFSTRAGALFGYRVLGVFFAVLLLKWALVFASARHWVFSEVHPLRRWAELPGPRAWLPWVLLLLAVPAFPVWVSFHAGTIGTLVASVTGTRDALGGGAPLAWGLAVLAAVLVLSATGSYARQEKLQALVVALMLGTVLVALIRLHPDWGAFLAGFGYFGPLHYPEWARTLPGVGTRPVWLEAATYAGVVGGSGYDYLAYVGWLREKHGTGGDRRVSPRALIRLVAADTVVSFLAVLLFSAVFVACGTIVLGPRHEVPAGSDLLTLQARIVSAVGDWLKPLYLVGALLALVGTLYGTLEVAPAVLRELLGAIAGADAGPAGFRWRRPAIGWSGLGAAVILAGSLAWRLGTGAKEPFDLVALVTPANLFTGVLACGWISLLNAWTAWRFEAREVRLPAGVIALNLLGGVAFTGAGLKGAWDQGGLASGAILVASLAAGLAVAWLRGRRR